MNSNNGNEKNLRDEINRLMIALEKANGNNQ